MNFLIKIKSWFNEKRQPKYRLVKVDQAHMSYSMFAVQAWTEQEGGEYIWRTMQEFTNELEARRMFARVKSFAGQPKVVVLDEI